MYREKWTRSPQHYNDKLQPLTKLEKGQSLNSFTSNTQIATQNLILSQSFSTELWGPFSKIRLFLSSQIAQQADKEAIFDNNLPFFSSHKQCSRSKRSTKWWGSLGLQFCFKGFPNSVISTVHFVFYIHHCVLFRFHSVNCYFHFISNFNNKETSNQTTFLSCLGE